MRLQITRNCHFISRSLTRPWEVEQRVLRYYDFDSDSFGSASSRRLFAADSLNTQAVETWLSRNLEGPLGQVRPRLVAGDPSALDDQEFLRACVLMLWLQGVRSSSVADEESQHEIEWLASRAEDELDQLTDRIGENYHLVLVPTLSVGGQIAPLFFPSTGLFPVAVEDPSSESGFSIALGLPVEVHCALVAIPRELEASAPCDLRLLPAQLSNWSIGSAAARRVVLPPGLLDTHTETQVRDCLMTARQQCTEVISGITAVSGLIAHAYGVAGITAEIDLGHRVRPARIE